jgi:hypothetical protein
VLRVTDGQEKMLYLRPIKKEEYSRSRKKIFTQHNLEDMKSCMGKEKKTEKTVKPCRFMDKFWKISPIQCQQIY